MRDSTPGEAQPSDHIPEMSEGMREVFRVGADLMWALLNTTGCPKTAAEIAAETNLSEPIAEGILESLTERDDVWASDDDPTFYQIRAEDEVIESMRDMLSQFDEYGDDTADDADETVSDSDGRTTALIDITLIDVETANDEDSLVEIVDDLEHELATIVDDDDRISLTDGSQFVSRAELDEPSIGKGLPALEARWSDIRARLEQEESDCNISR